MPAQPTPIAAAPASSSGRWPRCRPRPRSWSGRSAGRGVRVPAVAVVGDGGLGGVGRDLGVAGRGRGLGGERRGDGGGGRAEVDVGAAVERLRAVAALPDHVQQLAAGALRQGAGVGVVAVAGGAVDLHLDHRGRVEVRPLQRLGGVVARLGEVDGLGADVRRGGAELEGERAGLDRGGGPVGARPVQGGVLVAVGRAEPAVRDQRLVVAVGVGDVDLVPVVQRLGAARGDEVLADLGHRVLGALRVAGGDPADGVGHRAVGTGGAGGGRGHGEDRGADHTDGQGTSLDGHGVGTP